MVDLRTFYKVRIEGWLPWPPDGCELEDIGRQMTAGDGICTKMETVLAIAAADLLRTPDVMEEGVLSFFGLLEKVEEVPHG